MIVCSYLYGLCENTFGLQIIYNFFLKVYKMMAVSCGQMPAGGYTLIIEPLIFLLHWHNKKKKVTKLCKDAGCVVTAFVHI